MITTDLENDTIRIGEGVNVGAVDNAVLRGIGDDMQTLSANDGADGVFLRFIGRRGERVISRLAGRG